MIRKSQRFCALRDIEVNVLTHFRAPFTGGAKGTLPAGEVFAVAIDPAQHSTAANCNPESYDQLHNQLVPKQDRLWHNYSGYSLVIDLETIQQDCEALD